MKLPGVGLMDGGIVDNQGVQSALLAGERVGKSISLIIISDVSSPFMTPFKSVLNSDENREAFRFLDSLTTAVGNAKRILSFAFFAGIILLFSGLLNQGKIHSFFLFLSGMLIGVPLAAFLLKIVIKQRLSKLIDEIFALIPQQYKPYLPALKKIKINWLFPMLINRYRSVLTMVSEVFMKQIRRLIYYKVYSDKDWEFKRISNFIYEFVEKKTGSQDQDRKEIALKGPSRRPENRFS